MLALGVVLLGTLLTVVASYATGVSLPDMVGILCGATTNTPALGAAQQTLKQMGLESSTPALGCAVAYPMGVVGVILAILLIRKALVRKEDLEIKEKDDANKTYIAAFQVHNPAIFNKSIKDIAHLSYPKFVISRLWRDGHVSIPTSDKVLKEGDRLLVITAEKDALALTVLFGEQENTDWNKEDIDWNAIDSELVSQRIVVTRPELNGKKLGSLRLRNHYGINISRVYRSGVQLLATPELILQLGDRLTVVGEKAAILNVEKVLGNAIKSLKEPNLVVVFIGIVLGLAPSQLLEALLSGFLFDLLFHVGFPLLEMAALSLIPLVIVILILLLEQCMHDAHADADARSEEQNITNRSVHCLLLLCS